MKRVLPLAAAAAVVAIAAIGTGWSIDLEQPTTAATASSTSGQRLVDAGLADELDGVVVVDAAAVLELLEQIPADSVDVAGYSRDEFGQRWADTDRNGCDTRNDILRRDLVDVELKPGTNGCVVLTGTLRDLYTGEAIAFVRGDGTSQLVQIDHLWPLALSWNHGAATWSIEQRQTFANDPLNLQAVDGGANASKSDRGPGEWLPENPGAWCEYIARFVLIADVYELTIADVDRLASVTVLRGCRTG